MDGFKEIACEAVEANKEELHTLSQEIWRNPELNFDEIYSHRLLTDYLEKKGFVVTRHFVTDTGFKAEYGSSDTGPNIAVLCEYDALPEIGHACGHNLIAEAGVAAGIGIMAALKSTNKSYGKLTVLGTPAEEGGGGKVDMIRAGVFDDVDVAMMVHPAPKTISHTTCTAVDMVTVKYHGKAAHAAAYPWLGVNALDAAVLCYQNVSCQRQQMKPEWRVHGVIKNGGVKPNIIPELTELEYYFRTSNLPDLDLLREKMKSCFESAATTTGCKVEYSFSKKPYWNLVTNSRMADCFKKHAESLGVVFDDPKDNSGGSTDMGNVSQTVPSIHPFYSIDTKSVNHTREFTAASGDSKAQSYTLAQGKAMALTALELFVDQELMGQVKKEFEEMMSKRTEV